MFEMMGPNNRAGIHSGKTDLYLWTKVSYKDIYDTEITHHIELCQRVLIEGRRFDVRGPDVELERVRGLCRTYDTQDKA
jgi:hypothetical protein